MNIQTIRRHGQLASMRIVVWGLVALGLLWGVWRVAPTAAANPVQQAEPFPTEEGQEMGEPEEMEESAEANAFPFLAGFPRTDPSNIEFAGTAVVDLNGDGTLEIITADGRGRVWAFNHNGSVVSNFPLETPNPNCTTSGRINGPVAIGNVRGDARPEIIAGTRGCGSSAGRRGRVYVWNHQGQLTSGWPKEIDWNTAEPSTAEVYSIALANVVGTAGGHLEVIAGTSNSAPSFGSAEHINTSNLYVWRGDGGNVGNYPTWYKTAGIWGAVATADLNNNGLWETIAGRDHVYVAIYNHQGNPLPNFPLFTPVRDADKDKQWGTFSYGEFTRSAPVVGDINGDGQLNIIFPGHIRNPNQGHNVTNHGLWVIRPDGTRLPSWENSPTVGAAVHDNFMPMYSASLGDLGRNGQMNIVVPYPDGYVRAYRPDGTVLWSYNYAQGRKLFASEVVIGDVSGDGLPDVVFGTYAPTTEHQSSVRLIALHGTSGAMITGFPLTLPNERGDKRGIRSAPTLADLTGDCTVEIIAASWSGAVYVWNLTAPYYWDQMWWPTARHDNQRTGSLTGMRATQSGCAASVPFDNFTYLPIIRR